MALVLAAGVLTLLVGFTRIYLGVHYPGDVASGMALGAARAFALHALFEAGRR